MSFSEASEAEPRSHSLRRFFASFTYGEGLSTTTGMNTEVTNQDIIRLNIRVHNVAFTQKTHSKEQLVSVRPHGADVESNIFAKTFHNISQIHTVGKVNDVSLNQLQR